MAHQTPLQHQAARQPTADAQSTRTAGPHQASLSALSATLNTAPRVRQLKALEATVQHPPNRTGLPDGLKRGMEALSGMRLDHVKVHYNSSRPAQYEARAYAHGSDIHLAPGQEQHLPHEAWHVVQQAQGRVRPTLQLRQGMAVNDDASLEREADAMGARALQAGGPALQRYASAPQGLPMPAGIVQRRIVQQPAGFAVQGRLAGHDSAANKRALSAKMRARQAGVAGAGAGVLATHPHARNNFHEASLHTRAAGGAGGPANFISGNLRVPNLGISLAICHKMSSEAVQQEIAQAANAGLPALQNTAQSLINGIAPPAWGVAANPDYQVFLQTCQAHWNGANALLAQIAAGGALNAADLTRLAGLIANSPANLFIGDGTTNSTIQSRGDFNSTNIQPPVAVAGRMRRRLTPDSATLRASIQAAIAAGHIPAGTELNPITLAEGRAAAAGTNRQAWAAQVPAAVPGNDGALSSAVARDYTML